MGRHRLARPDRTYFSGGVVANGEHKIHLRRPWFPKFIPRFAAKALCGQTSNLELFQCFRPHQSRTMASGAISGEVGPTLTIEDSLGHYGASGIARAEKQYVVGSSHH